MVLILGNMDENLGGTTTTKEVDYDHVTKESSLVVKVENSNVNFVIDIYFVTKNFQEIVEGTPNVSKVVWSVVQKNNRKAAIVTKGVINSSSLVVNKIFQLLDRDECDMPDNGLVAINTLKSGISDTHSIHHEVESAIS